MPLRTNIYLPLEQVERLRKLARKKDVSVSELIRRAVEAYLAQQEGKAKRA